MKRLAVLVSFICLTFSASWSFAFDIVKSAKVDLNGDGKTEEISISGVTESGDFVLSVGRVSIKGTLTAGEADGFTIVDIDTTDEYKEIAVHTPGPSDDDEYLIYWYDGKLIKEVGRLSRWPKFFGDGIVHVGDWMGFWSKREKYVLDKKTRILQLVPQELYYVGIEAKVRGSFPIYKTRGDSTIVANLKPPSKVLILLCDPSPTSKGETDDYFDDYFCDWYLIKSETGIVGWARLKTFYRRLEGLVWAD